jgi:hypothetical protein
MPIWRARLSLQVTRGGAPPVGTQAGGDGNQLAAALRVAHGKRDADHPAQARANERHRDLAGNAIEPRGHEIGQPGHRDCHWRCVIVEAAPR